MVKKFMLVSHARFLVRGTPIIIYKDHFIYNREENHTTNVKCCLSSNPLWSKITIYNSYERYLHLFTIQFGLHYSNEVESQS